MASDDTLSKVLLEVGDIKGSVGEIKGTLKGFLATQVHHSDSIEALNKRVNVLENSKHRMLGAVGVVAAVVPLAVTYLAKKVGL